MPTLLVKGLLDPPQAPTESEAQMSDEFSGLSKTQVISLLTKSPHGDLAEYLPVGRQAAREDPDFFAHLIAWNHKNGQVRDAKIALPIVAIGSEAASLASSDPIFAFHAEFLDNAFAHLASLDPRNLVRGLRFAKEVAKDSGRGRALRRLVESYLRYREARMNLWNRAALQHRASMKELYALYHIKPSEYAENILFKKRYPAWSPFFALAALQHMEPSEAAGTILRHRLPFLPALGALGTKTKDPALAMALIEQMSPSELVTSTKLLERLGLKTNPALRGAYEAALQRAAESKTAAISSFKAGRAATALVGSSAAKLNALQEKQADALGGIEGDWLVLVDKSSSMQTAIEAGRQIAAVLARMVKGKVWMVFFDNTPSYRIDATGKTLEEIQKETAMIRPGGGTSMGAGLLFMLEGGRAVNGIAIVTDGGERHAPAFGQVYQTYCRKLDIEPSIYIYEVAGADPNYLAKNLEVAGIDHQGFNLRGGVDYYSLPNLVKTMNPKRYTLIDQIMETPLLTLEGVFKTEVEVA